MIPFLSVALVSPAFLTHYGWRLKLVEATRFAFRVLHRESHPQRAPSSALVSGSTDDCLPLHPVIRPLLTSSRPTDSGS